MERAVPHFPADDLRPVTNLRHLLVGAAGVRRDIDLVATGSPKHSRQPRHPTQ